LTGWPSSASTRWTVPLLGERISFCNFHGFDDEKALTYFNVVAGFHEQTHDFYLAWAPRSAGGLLLRTCRGGDRSMREDRRLRR